MEQLHILEWVLGFGMQIGVAAGYRVLLIGEWVVVDLTSI